MDLAEPGRDIGRDIGRSEAVEHELNTFITRRHNDRVATEGECRAEELWREAERRYNARRREENRRAWCDYFSRLAGSLRTRAEEYDQRAKAMMEPERKDTA